MSVAKLIIIGNLGKDATVNAVNGKQVINFSVAHTEKFKDQQGNQQEKTLWVECAKWGENTNVAPYLKKGTQVYVEGTPEVRMWESNGKHGASLTLRVMNVSLLGGNPNNNSTETATPAAASTGAPAAQAAPAGTGAPVSADDLPF